MDALEAEPIVHNLDTGLYNNPKRTFMAICEPTKAECNYKVAQHVHTLDSLPHEQQP